MDWDFVVVMVTLAGSGVIAMLGWAVAHRIAQGGDKKHIDTGGMDAEAQDRLLASLSNVEERMANLEERFEFNERLLQGRTTGQDEPEDADAPE